MAGGSRYGADSGNGMPNRVTRTADRTLFARRRSPRAACEFRARHRGGRGAGNACQTLSVRLGRRRGSKEGGRRVRSSSFKICLRKERAGGGGRGDCSAALEKGAALSATAQGVRRNSWWGVPGGSVSPKVLSYKVRPPTFLVLGAHHDLQDKR